MRLLLATLLLTSTMLQPFVAEASDQSVEATISAVDYDGQTLTLDDGNTYRLPGEFNFEGLEEGARVYVYYSVANGERQVFDLEFVN